MRVRAAVGRAALPPITFHCISLQPSHHLSLYLTAALPSPLTASHCSSSITSHCISLQPFHSPPHLPESLIHRAVPADKGAGSEKEQPEHRQPKA